MASTIFSAAYEHAGNLCRVRRPFTDGRVTNEATRICTSYLVWAASWRAFKPGRESNTWQGIAPLNLPPSGLGTLHVLPSPILKHFLPASVPFYHCPLATQCDSYLCRQWCLWMRHQLCGAGFPTVPCTLAFHRAQYVFLVSYKLVNFTPHHQSGHDSKWVSTPISEITGSLPRMFKWKNTKWGQSRAGEGLIPSVPTPRHFSNPSWPARCDFSSICDSHLLVTSSLAVTHTVQCFSPTNKTMMYEATICQRSSAELENVIIWKAVLFKLPVTESFFFPLIFVQLLPECISVEEWPLWLERKERSVEGSDILIKGPLKGVIKSGNHCKCWWCMRSWGILMVSQADIQTLEDTFW